MQNTEWKRCIYSRLWQSHKVRCELRKAFKGWHWMTHGYHTKYSKLWNFATVHWWKYVYQLTQLFNKIDTGGPSHILNSPDVKMLLHAFDRKSRVIRNKFEIFTEFKSILLIFQSTVPAWQVISGLVEFVIAPQWSDWARSRND